MRTVHEKIIRAHHLMLILSELREQIEKWLKEYHDERAHKSLGHLTPREYLSTKKPESLVTRGCNRERVTQYRVNRYLFPFVRIPLTPPQVAFAIRSVRSACAQADA